MKIYPSNLNHIRYTKPTIEEILQKYNFPCSITVLNQALSTAEVFYYDGEGNEFPQGRFDIPSDYLFQKALLKTDTAPTIKGLYPLSETGIYTNLGGINAQSGKLNFASFDGTTWKLIAVDMPKGEDGKTIENWSAKSFTIGSQVFYNGEIYEANEAASSTNIPNENPLIWKKVLSNNIIYSEVDFEISDEKSKSIVQFLDGHVKTKNFDSRSFKIDDSAEDFEISDENSKSIVKFIDGHIQTKNFDSKNINTETVRELKILFIGNSFSSDAAMYLPAHLKNIAPEINLTIGIGVVGGCTLQMHYNYSQNNQSVYYYHKSVGGDKWTTISGKTLQEVITQDEWDIISFQQQSASSRDYATYQPYLNNLVNWVYGLRKNVRLAWLFTPPLPTGGIGMPSGMTSNQFFQDMTVAVSKVMNETAIEFLFPCGTAIQNARTTALNNIGGF